ncbi:hypothetical protein BZZ01_22440 [Nostocales cyanobacterium HT-58-2]|nr:hypothetical protein BZZ01_22440 [Nostocales cyanobacterium HT-58-2]
MRQSFDEINGDLLNKMRLQEEKLRSPEIQLAFENEPDQAKRKAFLEARNRYRDAWMKLEREKLENHAINLQSLDPKLNEAVEELETELERVQSTVATLSTIGKVTSILARIVTII